MMRFIWLFVPVSEQRLTEVFYVQSTFILWLILLYRGPVMDSPCRSIVKRPPNAGVPTKAQTPQSTTNRTSV